MFHDIKRISLGLTGVVEVADEVRALDADSHAPPGAEVKYFCDLGW